MALTITTTITVADDEAYTAREQAILAAIAAHPAGKGIVAEATAAPAEKSELSKAADARIAESRAKAKAEAEAKAAAAEKAAKAAEAKAAKEAAAAEAAAAEEPVAAAEEADDDLVGGDSAYTLEDAVAAATKLVSSGQSAQVKAALAAAGGAKKVSELKGDGIATFMQALEV